MPESQPYADQTTAPKSTGILGGEHVPFVGMHESDALEEVHGMEDLVSYGG